MRTPRRGCCPRNVTPAHRATGRSRLGSRDLWRVLRTVCRVTRVKQWSVAVGDRAGAGCDRRRQQRRRIGSTSPVHRRRRRSAVPALAAHVMRSRRTDADQYPGRPLARDRHARRLARRVGRPRGAQDRHVVLGHGRTAGPGQARPPVRHRPQRSDRRPVPRAGHVRGDRDRPHPAPRPRRGGHGGAAGRRRARPVPAVLRDPGRLRRPRPADRPTPAHAVRTGRGPPRRRPAHPGDHADAGHDPGGQRERRARCAQQRRARRAAQRLPPGRPAAVADGRARPLRPGPDPVRRRPAHRRRRRPDPGAGAAGRRIGRWRRHGRHADEARRVLDRDVLRRAHGHRGHHRSRRARRGAQRRPGGHRLPAAGRDRRDPGDRHAVAGLPYPTARVGPLRAGRPLRRRTR